MSKLILRRFRCREETDEVGDDSPYFLVFHGRARQGSTSASSSVKLVRKSAWDHTVAEGELIIANMTVLDPLSVDLVLVAMMEEDHGTDFSGAQLERLRGWICPFFNGLADAVASLDSKLLGLVRDEFRRGIRALNSNDDLITVRTVVGPGVAMPPPLLRFAGDGGRYDVRFAVN